MTLDTEIARKVRKLREAAQRREEMERRLDLEHWWLVGACLGCLLFSGLCIGGNENVGGFFFALSLFALPFVAAHRYVIRPMRRARFARQEAKRRLAETREEPAGRDAGGGRLRALSAGLFCLSVCLFLGLGFWVAMRGGRPNREIMQALLISMAGSAILFALFSRPKAAPLEAGSFPEVLTRIMVAFARADGRFTRAELTVILDFYRMKTGHDEARLADLKRLLKRSLDDPGDIGRLLETLAARFSYLDRLTAADMLFRLALARTPPLAAKLDLARDIATILDILPDDLKNIEAKCRKAGGQAEAAAEERARQAESARQRQERERREREERLKRERAERERREREERQRREQEEARRRAERERRARFSAKDERAFAVLGLEPGAKFAAIKKNYRKLIVQYHPDKVGHLGEEYRRIATEKTKELNAAYRHLAERFGK